MIPTVIQERVQKERLQYMEKVYVSLYWTSQSSMDAIKHLIHTLHDDGYLTQGELSELWTIAFLLPVPYLPNLESISSSMDWSAVYHFISVLHPYQLFHLHKKMN